MSQGRFSGLPNQAWAKDGRAATPGVDLVARLQHRLGVYGVAFSHDGSYVLTGSETAQIWELGTESQALLDVRMPGSGHVTAVTCCPDGRCVVLGGLGRAYLWDTHARATIREFKGHSASIWRVRVSADGSCLLTLGQDARAKLWEIATGSMIRCFPPLKHRDDALDATYSVDGRLVATIAFPWGVELWNASSGKRLGCWERPNMGATPSCCGFTRSGDALFVGCHDGITYVWEFASGGSARRFGQHHAHIQDVAFSPDGRCLLTASADHTARLWDVATTEELAVLTGHRDRVFRAAFSSDGEQFATGSYDGEAYLYRITDW